MERYKWLTRTGVKLGGNCEKLKDGDPEELLPHLIRCFVNKNKVVLREKKKEKVSNADFKYCEVDCPAANLFNGKRRRNGRKKR